MLINNFGIYQNFTISYNENNKVIVCNFIIEDTEIEIYGSKEETHELDSYRHMIIEYRLLMIGGKKLKDSIINLKKQGLKTELAFAKVLQIEGNPYEQLLLLEGYTDEELIKKYLC